MKKTTYYYHNENANIYFENELFENLKSHNEGERVSVSLHYADNSGKKTISFSQLKMAVADVSFEGQFCELDDISKENTTKVIIRKISKSDFDSKYTLKEWKAKEPKADAKKSKYDLLKDEIEKYISDLSHMELKGVTVSDLIDTVKSDLSSMVNTEFDC